MTNERHAFDPCEVKELTPFGNTILVYDMQFDERLTTSGIVLLNDDMKSSGIRPRWARVYAIGPDQKDVEVGQWLLISHGRWSRGVKIKDATGEKTIRKVDPNDILLQSDERGIDETMSDKVMA